MAEDGSVELRFPATARHLRLARLTASGFASDLGYSVDEIEELRLAVDEACALLVDAAGDRSAVEVTYRTENGTLVIDGRCAGAADASLELNPVAKAVLHTTVDDYEVYAAPDGANAFRIVKRRGERS